MGAPVPLRRESPKTIARRLFLVVLVVIRGADRAASLSSSVSPGVTGLSSSVCRTVKQFLQGHLSLQGKFLPPAGSPLQPSILLPHSLLCVLVGEFLAVGPLQTVLGTSYLTPPQPP